jgi:hypothetical protein
MAGIGEAAAALQLAGAACNALKMLWKEVKELRDAVENVELLSQELSETEFMLFCSRTSVEKFLHRHGAQFPTFQPIARLDTIYRELSVILFRVKPHEDVNRLAWLAEVKECRKLVIRLKDARTTMWQLCLLLQA